MGVEDSVFFTVVAPSLGIVIANLLFAAPFNAVKTVRRNRALGVSVASYRLPPRARAAGSCIRCLKACHGMPSAASAAR